MIKRLEEMGGSWVFKREIEEQSVDKFGKENGRRLRGIEELEVELDIIKN